MTKTGQLLGPELFAYPGPELLPEILPGAGDKAGDFAACSVLFPFVFFYTFYCYSFDRFVSVSKSKLYYKLIKFCPKSLLIIFNLKYCTNSAFVRFCGSNITDCI